MAPEIRSKAAIVPDCEPLMSQVVSQPMAVNPRHHRSSKLIRRDFTLQKVLTIFFIGSLAIVNATKLGSKCQHDMDCTDFIKGSTCSAYGHCECAPYFVQFDDKTCLSSQLLGGDCQLDDQCTMKVANSSCLDGACRCVEGFLQFRKHTCLGPALPGAVCYSHDHCQMNDEHTHCDFLIPNLFGRCQCTAPTKLYGGLCLEAADTTTTTSSSPAALADAPIENEIQLQPIPQSGRPSLTQLVSDPEPVVEQLSEAEGEPVAFDVPDVEAEFNEAVFENLQTTTTSPPLMITSELMEPVENNDEIYGGRTTVQPHMLTPAEVTTEHIDQTPIGNTESVVTEDYPYKIEDEYVEDHHGEHQPPVEPADHDEQQQPLEPVDHDEQQQPLQPVDHDEQPNHDEKVADVASENASQQHVADQTESDEKHDEIKTPLVAEQIENHHDHHHHGTQQSSQTEIPVHAAGESDIAEDTMKFDYDATQDEYEYENEEAGHVTPAAAAAVAAVHDEPHIVESENEPQPSEVEMESHHSVDAHAEQDKQPEASAASIEKNESNVPAAHDVVTERITEIAGQSEEEHHDEMEKEEQISQSIGNADHEEHAISHDLDTQTDSPLEGSHDEIKTDDSSPTIHVDSDKENTVDQVTEHNIPAVMEEEHKISEPVTATFEPPKSDENLSVESSTPAIVGDHLLNEPKLEETKLSLNTEKPLSVVNDELTAGIQNVTDQISKDVEKPSVLEGQQQPTTTLNKTDIHESTSSKIADQLPMMEKVDNQEKLPGNYSLAATVSSPSDHHSVEAIQHKLSHDDKKTKGNPEGYDELPPGADPNDFEYYNENEIDGTEIFPDGKKPVKEAIHQFKPVEHKQPIALDSLEVQKPQVVAATATATVAPHGVHNVSSEQKKPLAPLIAELIAHGNQQSAALDAIVALQKERLNLLITAADTIGTMTQAHSSSDNGSSKTENHATTDVPVQMSQFDHQEHNTDAPLDESTIHPVPLESDSLVTEASTDIPSTTEAAFTSNEEATANPGDHIEITTQTMLGLASRVTLMEPTAPVATTLKPLMASADVTEEVAASEIVTSEPIKLEATTTTTTTMELATANTKPSTEIRKRVDLGLEAVSLGLKCINDKQCQLADPHTICNQQGVCDCTAVAQPLAVVAPPPLVAAPTPIACNAKQTGCSEGTFQCRSSGVCISWFFVCDGRNDCNDASDEECTYNIRLNQTCPAEAFHCGQSGRCVSRATLCDGRKQCPHGEDEYGCGGVMNSVSTSCPPHTFRCNSGECLPEYEYCNAIISCKDGSDEPPHLCGERTMPNFFSRLQTGGVGGTGSVMASGRANYPGGYCPHRCSNGRCRSTAIVCSGRDGCGDGTDEHTCSVCRCPMPTGHNLYAHLARKRPMPLW